MTEASTVRDWCRRAENAGRSPDPSRLLTDVLCAAVGAELGGWAPAGTAALVASATRTRDLHDTAIDAVPAGRAWLLTGHIRHVAGALGAEQLLVVARCRPMAGRDRGLRAYAFAPDVPGVQVTPRRVLDDDGSASVALTEVSVEDADAVGPPRDAAAAVDRALDLATLVAVAEMVGAAQAALDAAAAWVTARVQFGAVLADKQAVQHRCADMAMAIAAVTNLLDDALARLDAGAPIATEAALAKLLANEALPTVTAGAHQLHGGEGYYADRPLHRWHRRVLARAAQLGDSSAQRHRLGGAVAALADTFSPIGGAT